MIAGWGEGVLFILNYFNLSKNFSPGEKRCLAENVSCMNSSQLPRKLKGANVYTLGRNFPFLVQCCESFCFADTQLKYFITEITGKALKKNQLA